MKRRFIGKRDMSGRDIHVGDAFEYGDCIYIVAEDGEGELFIRQFENTVQYGADYDAEYEEIESMHIEDMQFSKSEIIGSIEDNKLIKDLYEREYNPKTFEDEG